MTKNNLILIFLLLSASMQAVVLYSNNPDSIQPDTIITTTIRNDIIKIDTIRTDSIITKVIYEDSVIADTVVNITNFGGVFTKDTAMKVVKIINPSPWKIGGNGNFHLSQAFLSYWMEGGESSITVLTDLSLFANYSKNNRSWDNDIQVKYGTLNSKSSENFRKNEDRIEINTKYGFKAFRKFYYSSMINFKSQMFKGYEQINDSTREMVSKFMNPGRLLVAIGMDYKPTKKLSVLLSPLSGKSTFVTDTANIDQTKFGLEDTMSIKNEFGAYLKTHYKLDITKNILLENRLDFFSNYFNHPERIDVDWEANLIMKINKYMTANISTHLIYDDDVDIPLVDDTGEPVIKENGEQKTSKRIQFKEIFSIGFSYKF